MDTDFAVGASVKVFAFGQVWDAVVVSYSPAFDEYELHLQGYKEIYATGNNVRSETLPYDVYEDDCKIRAMQAGV